MIRGFFGWAVVGIVIAIMGAAASMLTRAAQERSATAVAVGIREELTAIRTSLETCQEAQDRLQGDFDAVTQRTAGLRDELDRLEDLDPRGVPRESYDIYLELVEEYNESIAEWESLAERLRDQSSSCRNLIESHNEQADSLRRFLLDEGLIQEGWVE